MTALPLYLLAKIVAAAFAVIGMIAAGVEASKKGLKDGTLHWIGRCEKGHRQTKLDDGMYFCPTCSGKPPEISLGKPSWRRRIRWWLFSENANEAK